MYIYLDRKRRRRKFLMTTFLRALGYGTDEELLKLYYTFEKSR
jgi:DNA-directed RNA polymerase subunit beta